MLPRPGRRPSPAGAVGRTTPATGSPVVRIRPTPGEGLRIFRRMQPARRLVIPALLVFLPTLLADASAPVVADGEPAQRRNQVVETVERAKPAVVSVRTTQRVARSLFDWDDLVLREEPAEVEGGLGSGVIFHPAGFVITNAHVIAHASSLFVEQVSTAGGSVGRRALPFAVDLTNDLAILRIVPLEGATSPETFPFLSLGRSDDLLLGETVIAVGNPFKLGLSVSTGVVAGLNRSLRLGRRTFDDFVQVSAPINPGNSGGALLDVTGRWIGVTTAIYSRVYGAEGIAFAIPADRVRRLVGTAFRRRVLTGDWVGLDEAEGPAAAAAVKAVFPRGPAAGTGIEAGDVILSVNGALTPTLYDYSMAMLALPAGSVVRLGLVRAGRELPTPVSLALTPVPTDALSLEHLGLLASDVAAYEGGVVVRSVEAGGPAERLGLRTGDVIRALGSWRVRHTDDLLVFLQMVKSDDLVDVVAQRPPADGSGQPVRNLTGRLRAR